MSRILVLASLPLVLLGCMVMLPGTSEKEKAFRAAPDFELVTVFGSRSLVKEYEQIEIVGDYAYLLLNDKSTVPEVNFMIVDISEPSRPRTVSLHDVTYTPYIPTGFAITERYAFITREDFGVEVVDISDKANPVSAGIYENVVGRITRVVAVDHYVFYYDGSSSWHVLDMSDPQDIEMVTKLRNIGEPMVVSGKYIYAVQFSDETNRSTLQVVDVSDPANPTPVFEGFQFWPIGDIAIWGERAYAMSSADRTYILDISQPGKPELVAAVNQGGNAISATSDTIYVITDTGLMAVDVSDESNGAPKYLATIGEDKLRDLLQTKGVTYSENADGSLELYKHIGMDDVATAKDHIYVMDSTQGLMIFKSPE